MKIFICLLIGFFTWPVVEYLLHRYLGHVLKVNTLFRKEHTRHHAETNYFAPLAYKFVAAIPVTLFFIITLSYLTGSKEIAISFTLGFLLMFSLYEYVHWSFHAKAPKTKLGMELRKHHFFHHFHNPKMNHGVTSTLIDKLAGTYVKSEIVKVPRHVALSWLFVPGTDNIEPKFSQDFVLR